VIESIAKTRENKRFLPGAKLSKQIESTGDIAHALSGADAILLSSPAQHLRAILQTIKPHVKAGTPLVVAAKGIELGTGLLVTEVLSEIVPNAEPAVLSGPSFARDVATVFRPPSRSLPTRRSRRVSRTRSAAPPSALTSARISSASRSAVPRRTSTRSPAVSSKVPASAKAPAPPRCRAALPS
jgi:hypothetical protein